MRPSPIYYSTVGVQRRRKGDHPSGDSVQNDSKEQEAGPSRGVGDVCNRQCIRFVCMEVAVHNVSLWAKTIIPDRGAGT